MKKIIFSLIAVATAFAAAAQTNPLEVVPNRKGEHIDTKCYDAAGNLRATMRYEISDYTPNAVEDDLKIVFTMTDGSGRVIDYGTIWADYDGEEVLFRMSNRPEVSNINGYLSLNTKLMNDFLDYPDTMSEDMLNPGPFRFDGADYTIKTGRRGRNFVNVRVRDRELVGTEKVTTPAGEFDASKIKFAVDVYNNNTRKHDTYHGTEWFAVGEGIVRTEITDKAGHLVDYSEMARTYTRR